MGKMKRLAAWILLMAMLLSSFAFAEEGMVTEEAGAVEAPSGEVMVVDEYCDHSYGEWTDCGDGYHQFRCFKCGHMDEKEEHYVYNGVNECWACGLKGVCKHDGRIYYEILADGTHWKLCLQCYDYLEEPQKHSYKDGICEYCGLLNECSHEEYIWTSNGDGTHSSYCASCGEPGGATWDCFPHCSDPTKCRDCGAPYTGNEAPGHSYAGNYVDLGNGNHAMECTSCGERFREESHFIYCNEAGKTSCSGCGLECNPVIKHETWNDEEDRENWVYGNQYAHGRKCVYCKKWVGSSEAHTYADGYCTKCGARNSCRHSKINSHRQVKDTGDGIHHSLTCIDCGEMVKLEEHTMSGGKCLYCNAKGPCGHESTGWKDLGDGTHGEVCAYCGEKTSDKTEAHYVKCSSGSNLCSGCGAEVSEDAIEHNYIYPYMGTRDNWVNQNYGKHALICYDCNAEKAGSNEAHTIEDGKCTKCDYYDGEHDCFDYCDSNSGFCYVCGKETAGVGHRGGYEDVKVNEYFHGRYCERCDVYYDLAVHHNYCFNDGYCYEKEGDYCGEKVNSKYVPVTHVWIDAVQDSEDPDYHSYICIQCGKTVRELHEVGCDEEDKNCYKCGAYVEKGKKHTQSDVCVVLPDNPGKHGWACSCGEEVLYPVDHNYLNGYCQDCGVEMMSVTGVEFASASMTMAVGQTAAAEVQVKGSAARMEYKSSNAKVAAIDESGAITAKKAGSATISVVAYGADGTSAKAQMKLTIKKAPTKIALDSKEIEIPLGMNAAVKAKLSPSGAYAGISWTSDNESIATVDEKGNISTLAEGSATITATTVNGLSASCIVKVLGAPAALEIGESEISLNVKKSRALEVKAVTESGNDAAGELEYASSNAKIAAVDKNGKVTGKKAGEAVITVSTYNGITAEVLVKVYAEPKKVTLNVIKATIVEGETLQLVPQIAEDAYTTYSYSTSAKKVATVDENGLVSAIAEGSATITVKTANNKKATCKLTVVDPKKVAAIELKETGTVVLGLGDTLTLHASIMPATAETELSWASSNERIATVEDGVVTPVKEGTVTITVKSANGKKDTVKVQVVDPKVAAAVELSESGTVTIKVGETLQLEATVLPATAETELKWSSNKAKYATVDENGLVTGVKAGTATITVKTENGKADTVKVKVVK